MSLARKIKALAAETGFGKVETVLISEAPNEEMRGRCAIISGGTGGIGFAIARRFLLSGCSVVILGRDLDRGLAAEKELMSLDPHGDVLFVKCDVSEPKDLENLFPTLNRELPNFKVDILVNSAGVNRDSRFPYIEPDVINQVLSVNLVGLLQLSQHVALRMIDLGVRGNILNVGSVSGFRPASGVYEVSKWAVRGLTIGMADELTKYGIVVNSIAPGPTATAMTGRDGDSDLSLPWNPSGRMADPREIAHLATMLVSESGRLIVGDTLCASGGAGVVSLHR